ncbi:MAG: hypothetical protein IKP46_02380 [Bacteroidales bacterium]|nr:hypothetical protein [Bacteroidales bacterium]
MILALTGFMGCGKSSVGRLVAARLGCAFTDLDEAVEAAQGRSVARIFAEDGEAGFRAAELAALRAVIQAEAEESEAPAVIPSEAEESEISPRASLGRNDNVHVLALGGGTLTTPEARKLVAENTRCIYLRASVDTLVENLTMTGTSSRPLLEGADDEAALRSRIEAIMAERSAIYEEAADVIIDIDGLSCGQIADKVVADKCLTINYLPKINL